MNKPMPRNPSNPIISQRRNASTPLDNNHVYLVFGGSRGVGIMAFLRHKQKQETPKGKKYP